MVAPLKVDLESLGRTYSSALLANLRGFGANGDFLETWVPDTDPIKNICNLIDAVAENEVARVIEVRHSNTHGEGVSVDDLRDSLSSFVQVDIDYQEENMIIRISGIEFGRQNCISPGTNRRNKARRNCVDTLEVVVTKVGGLKIDRNNLIGLSSTQSYDFDKVPKHSDTNPESDSRCIVIEKEEDELKICMEIDPQTHHVEKFEFRCEPNTWISKLLTHAAKLFANIPIQEVCDHGIMYLESRLRSENWKQPVPGIFLPGKVFYEFNLLESLLRKIYSEYRDLRKYTSTNNNFDPGPSTSWKALQSDEKVSRIEMVLKELATTEGHSNARIEVVNVEYNVRVTVRIFQLNLENILDKQKIVMVLEEQLRQRLDPRIELYLEPVSDLSTLRRLELTPNTQ